MKSVVAFLFLILVSLPTFADIDASPFSINFGYVNINSYGPNQTIFVRNMLNTAVQVRVTNGCPFDFMVRNNCSLLSGYSSCIIDVTFRPYREGSQHCSIQIRDSANDWASVSVSGTGRKNN